MLRAQSRQFSPGEAGATHDPQRDGPPRCRISHRLFVLFDVSDHFVLKHLPHGLFYLLEEDLRDPPTQRVDRVQELGLDGVEQRLEHVVLEGILQKQRHRPVSLVLPQLFQLNSFFFFLWNTSHRLNGIYKLCRQGWGGGGGCWCAVLIINYDPARL